jgi:hypothetical protein
MSTLSLSRWLRPRFYFSRGSSPTRPAFDPAPLRALHQQVLERRGLTLAHFAGQAPVALPPAPSAPVPAEPTRTATRTPQQARQPRRRICLRCKTRLSGRQRFYCSEACGKAYRRRRGAPSARQASC